MNWIEILAVIFSLFSVILTVEESKWCWPTGIIGVIFFGILFYQNEIWGNMSLQLVFISQAILGWYNWNKPTTYTKKWVNKKWPLFVLPPIIASIVYLFVFYIDGYSPLLDSITTSLSIMAMMLLAYKKIDGWIFWILADIGFIYFFIDTELYLSAFIYFIFLLNAIRGLKKWVE